MAENKYPSQNHDLLGGWGKLYLGSFKGKKLLKRVWESIPKFVHEKVWISRKKNGFSRGKSGQHESSKKSDNNSWGISKF